MHILITCDRCPYTLSDGLILRIYHYVKWLTPRHTFDLVCLDSHGIRNPDLESHFRWVKCFPTPERHKPSNGFARLIDAFDIHSLYYHSQAVKQFLKELLEHEKYDLVWDAGCNMLFNLQAVRQQIPLLADQVDDSFLRLKRDRQLAKSIYQKIWFTKQSIMHWYFAYRYLRNAEAIWFVSELDQQSFLKACPTTNAIVIANGVDEEYFEYSVTHSQTANIAFEGSMAFGPNIDAVTYFSKYILPRIQIEIPQTNFTIIGRDPTPEVRALATDCIQVTGSVPDIRPYLAHANVFVCPMRSGAGIKNKILQAWAMGKAVVSTPQGAAGLDVQDGHNILIREHPDQFAEAVISLLRDPKQAQALGLQGRKTIEDSYTWKKKSQELEELMLHIVAKRSIANQTTSNHR